MALVCEGEKERRDAILSRKDDALSDFAPKPPRDGCLPVQLAERKHILADQLHHGMDGSLSLILY